jgi:hypothetical protein
MFDPIRGCMVEVVELNVIAYQEGEWWCAQCLEYDLAAQAKTLPDLHYEFERIVYSHLAISLELGQEPFEGLNPAPQKFWDMYEKAKMHIERENQPFRLPGPLPSVRPKPRLKIAEQHENDESHREFA